jgi:cytochrome c-type biogenesis protein CcmH/NrfG
MGRWEFWAIAMVMIVAASATIIVPALWFQRAPDDARFYRRRILASLAAVIVLPLAALVLYAILGSPALTSRSPGATPAMASHPPITSQTSTQGGELNAAIERLERKLRSEPQNVESWRLLSQSYAFTGRTADATRASEMADRAASGKEVTPPAAAAAAAVASSQEFTELEERLRKDPRDVDALILLAEGHRRRREFSQSLAAFARLVELKAMSADLWADYADALAADRGGLDAESAPLIHKALELDPRHPKALWLLGSWQTKSRDFPGAVDTWERLATVLPPASSDARIIAANLEEARKALASTASMQRATVNRPPQGSSARAEPIALSGEVQVDPKLRARIPAGATLFVFAKAVDSPGPPLAVVRSRVGAWPTRFKLDDAAAMLPERTLSHFQDVIVEARISRSGSATAERGDLRGASGVLNPRSSGPVRLVISEEIG